MSTDLECTKTVDVPEELEGTDLQHWLWNYGREQGCGDEYQACEEPNGDWSYGDAYIDEK